MSIESAYKKMREKVGEARRDILSRRTYSFTEFIDESLKSGADICKVTSEIVPIYVGGYLGGTFIQDMPMLSRYEVMTQYEAKSEKRHIQFQEEHMSFEVKCLVIPAIKVFLKDAQERLQLTDVYRRELLQRFLPNADITIKLGSNVLNENEDQGVKQEAFALGIIPYPDPIVD